MPEGKTPEGGEGETVEQVKAKLAEAETKLANASGELIDDRKKRQEVEGERDALRIKLAEAEARAGGGGDPVTVAESAARKVLAERDAETVKANMASAETAFRARYKEFATDNDQGGIKFAAVKARYDDFRKDGKASVEDFLRLFEDAYTLVTPTRSVPKATTYAPYISTSSNPGSISASADQSKLSSQEKEVVTRLGWTEEQYLKQKEKRPQYVASLLRSME